MIDAQVKAQVLRVLLKASGQPIPQATLCDALRLSFPHVSFTQLDLNRWIADCEELQWIAGTEDELLGKIWGLTAKGQLRAQGLRG